MIFVASLLLLTLHIVPGIVFAGYTLTREVENRMLLIRSGPMSAWYKE